MGRLRFLRIALPVLLLSLVLLVFRDCEWRPTAHTAVAPAGTARPSMEDVSIIDLAGPALKQAIDAGLIQEGPDGRLILRGIRRLEIARSDRGPLIVSAEEGEGVGPAGSRIWRFDREVAIRDPEADLELRLPELEVDEAAGQARASGDIRFSGSGLTGEASAVVYGVAGPPRELVDPRIRGGQLGRLTASRAQLHDGVRDIELLGSVTAERPSERLTAERTRLVRGADGGLQRMSAAGSVSGEITLAVGPPIVLGAEELEAHWSGDAIQRLDLRGGAALERDGQSLAAPAIEVDRREGGFAVEAGTPVEVVGLFEGAPALLRAEHLTASLDAAFTLDSGEATGRVRFTAGPTRAEADRAMFDMRAVDASIELFGVERHKARLARERTRVAADSIRTDPRGEGLDATGRVEATLLPAGASGGSLATPGLFEQDQAVHFVSARLVGEGSRLSFSGDVRAWQGERNLAAQNIVVEEQARRLTATQQVSTRIPREPSQAHVAEFEYVQITADRLLFDDTAGRATYEGGVRMVLAEGWLEAERVEVDLTDGRIAEVRAFDGVRLEFHASSGTELPIVGEGDRLRYDPVEQTVRVLGDRAPAVVRRGGPQGAATTGRVLRYRLDLGTLEVESGGQGATIRRP